MQHEYAEVNGVRLHYARAGAGKLILFVHGFPEFWYAWRRQLAEFGRDHLAVAPDLRGYNLSSRPRDVAQYDLALLVEDLRQLARHLTGEKFILVGHDWGGALTWLYAAQHPGDLEKLIIINSPHPAVFARELRHNPAQRRASAYMLLFRSPLAELLLSAFGYHALVRTVLRPGLRQGYFTEQDKAAYLEAWSQPGALRGGLNYYGAASLRRLREARAGQPGASPYRVTVPTLLLWGERDPYLLTGNLDGLEAYVPRLTVRRFPDASHWIVHEKPDEVNRVIREFLAR
jgi:pimeloyl-ACP methyl ester carboxylesterase